MKKIYGVVVIGCGHIGLEHLQAMYYRDDIRLIGTVDLKEENARFAAKKFGAQSFGTDYREYLSREDVDIVLCQNPSANFKRMPSGGKTRPL